MIRRRGALTANGTIWIEQVVCGTGQGESAAQGLSTASMNWSGKISFCQKDVREIQLAKSAVRAGLETLILRYGISWEEIDRVYVAGGFGHKMDIHKAVGIELFPASCEDKVEAAGDTCLQGAVKYLTRGDEPEAVHRLVEVSEEIGLSNDKYFQEAYMENMYFL